MSKQWISATRLEPTQIPFLFTADTSGVKTGDIGAVIINGGFYIRNAAYLTLDGFTVQVNLTKPAWVREYGRCLRHCVAECGLKEFAD